MKDKKGNTAYDLTLNPEISRLLQYQFMDYFRQNCPKPPTLTEQEAVQYGYAHPPEAEEDFFSVLATKSLLSFHEMLNRHHLTVNSYIGGTPIMVFACVIYELEKSYKNTAFIEYFLEKKVNLNLQAHKFQRDAYQGTVLHSMLANENVKNAMFVLNEAEKEGLNIDSTIRDIEGKTIVLMGVLLREITFVKACFVKLGIDAVNIADKEGRTPLHYAYLFGDSGMVECLKQHGADLNAVDNKGKSPSEMLSVEENVIVAAFNKFHIDATTRQMPQGGTLLEKCTADRLTLIEIEQEATNQPSSMR